MVTAFIGIGSNKGDRKSSIIKAIMLLKKHDQKIIKVSSLFDNEPYGYEKQNRFLNAVIKIKTSLDPEKLLNLCKKIESETGRKKTFRWGPREIDLDILFYGKKPYKSRNITVPHKDLHNRKFVLLPLSEIAGDFIHPALKKSINEIIG